MIGIRRMIEAQVLGLTGMALKEIDFERPKGEPGLFGPQSAIWQVHGDFTSMLCGGISALLLQMLHPLALAGVWDHSRFREDILGRLRRTSQFISATTFATTPDAERLIAKVQGSISGSPGWIRTEPVSGERPGAVNLGARRRVQLLYGLPPALQADGGQSRAPEDYFRESAEIARRLGLGISLRHRRRWRTISRRCARDCAATNVPGR